MRSPGNTLHANARAAALIAIAIAVTEVVGVLVMGGVFLGVVIDVGRIHPAMTKSYARRGIRGKESRRRSRGSDARLSHLRHA